MTGALGTVSALGNLGGGGASTAAGLAVEGTMRQGAGLLGMAHRFMVTVPGYTLGNWSKASGLKVNWQPVEHRPGDVVNGVWFYPGTAKYETIKLVRAADPKNSKATWNWLKTVSSTHVPQSGSITLYDPHNIPVFSWELDSIFPLSWGIEQFDASASKVALETLELQHTGFLIDEMKLSGPGTGALGKVAEGSALLGAL
jgi:phage tail-like protein